MLGKCYSGSNMNNKHSELVKYVSLTLEHFLFKYRNDIRLIGGMKIRIKMMVTDRKGMSDSLNLRLITSFLFV